MYAKHLAWLHAAPKQYKNDTTPLSRCEYLSKEDPLNTLPYADQYLIKCFHLNGVCSSNGMNIISLNWRDIKSFSNQSLYELSGWESEQIIKMSNDYCSMYSKANELLCPAPFDLTITDKDALERQRDLVNDKLSAILGVSNK